MKKAVLNKSAELPKELINKNYDWGIFLQWCLAKIDMIEYEIFKSAPSKSKSKVPTNICQIFFDISGLELVDLSKNLHYQSVLLTPLSNIRKRL